MSTFKVVSNFQPNGDQPKAIRELKRGILENMPYQTLMGVTGSGKTMTMAHVIAETQMPALVLAHNKTLAAQLCNEMKEFFPQNSVEYFISYYDYYMPESYIPSTDTFIEKTTARIENSTVQTVKINLLNQLSLIPVFNFNCIACIFCFLKLCL